MRVAHLTAALAVATAAFAQQPSSEDVCSGAATTATKTEFLTTTAVSTVFVTQISLSAQVASTGEGVVTLDTTSVYTLEVTKGNDGVAKGAASSITSAPVTANSGDVYMYFVTNGTTSWLSGKVPPSTLTEFATSTMTMSVEPVSPTSPLISVPRPQSSEVQVITTAAATGTVTLTRTLTSTLQHGSATGAAESTFSETSSPLAPSSEDVVTLTATHAHIVTSTVRNWNSTYVATYTNGTGITEIQVTLSPTSAVNATSPKAAAAKTSASAVDADFASTTALWKYISVGGLPSFSLGAPASSTAESSIGGPEVTSLPAAVTSASASGSSHTMTIIVANQTSKVTVTYTLPHFSLMPANETAAASSATISTAASSTSLERTTATAVDALFGSGVTASVTLSKIWPYLDSYHASSSSTAVLQNTSSVSTSTSSSSGLSSSVIGAWSTLPVSPALPNLSTTAVATMTTLESAISSLMTSSYTSSMSNSSVAGAIPTTLKTVSMPVLSSDNYTTSTSPSSAATATTFFTTVFSKINSASSSTASAAQPTTSSCGEVGDFIVNWDDAPIWISSTNETDIFPPVTQPYHHLFFSNGYGYVAPPNPNEPYAAKSSPNLAIFDPKFASSNFGSPDSNGVYPGEIGAGWRSSMNAYWFNARSVDLGCDGEPCTMVITGFRWDELHQQEGSFIEQNTTVPACVSKRGCQMQTVQLREEFQSMSGIQFKAFVNETVRSVFVLDNLALSWTNNSCAAGRLRRGGKK